MGRRLQHTVGYVPVSGDAAPGSAAYVRLGSPDRAKWEAALDRGEIGRVVVQEPWPVEDAWMRNDAARFTPVFQDGHLRIYKVVR